MRTTDQQILAAVRSGLKQLATELPSGSAAHLLSAIDIAVTELAARGGRAESLHVACAEARELATRAAALMAKVGADTLSAALKQLPETTSNNLDTLEDAYDRLKHLLVEATQALSRARSSADVDDVWQEEVADFFHDLARHEARRAGQNLVAPALEEAAKTTPIEAQLRDYLAHCAGSKDIPGPLHMESCKLLSGGFSRQTMLLSASDAKGNSHSLVVRKQVPEGFLDGACNMLAEEKPFLQLTHAAGLPVPKLYWHETDSAAIGGEFFVTECMPGTTLGSSYQMAQDIGPDLFKQLAGIMATLHRIDWAPHADALRACSRIPAGARADSTVAALAMVGQFEDYWRRAEIEPMPTMEMMVEWLKRNVPAVDRQAVLCHGDIGFHNLLIQDGRITAVLDWETSRLADPARDLAYMRPMVAQYVKWEEFMAWYCAAGGQEMDEASLDYYSTFAAWVHVLVCDVAMNSSFPRSARPNLEYLRLGLPVKAYFFEELLHTAAPVWQRKGK